MLLVEEEKKKRERKEAWSALDHWS